jgi:hypothetical protein
MFTSLLRHTPCLFLCALLPIVNVAAEPVPLHETFDIRSDPDFGNYQKILKPLAEKYRPGRPNDFCIVGYQVSAESKIAWIIWKQRSELILWEAGESDVDMSRRRLNLKKDVVGSESELRGSTYLVTKAWVNSVVNDCASHGIRLHLKK